MSCTFDKDGTLLKFESGGIWFNAEHYHEQKMSGSRDYPMGSLQSSIAEYEHRTGNRGTLALIEAERAAWLADPANAPDKLKQAEPVVVETETATFTATSTGKGTNVKVEPKKVSATEAVMATPAKAKPVAKKAARKAQEVR